MVSPSPERSGEIQRPPAGQVHPGGEGGCTVVRGRRSTPTPRSLGFVRPAFCRREPGEVEKLRVEQMARTDIAERPDHDVLAAGHAALEILEHGLHGVALKALLRA